MLYNRGVAAATAEFVLLANNDVALEPACLERLRDALEADRSTFAADPTQLDWAGERVDPRPDDLARGRLTREYLPGLHLDPVVPADRVTPTVCANGAAMLVRRSIFEDSAASTRRSSWSGRISTSAGARWLRGCASVYVPDARVRHRVGAVTTDAVRAGRRASSHHNLVRFALKCLPPAAAARVLLGELLRLPPIRGRCRRVSSHVATRAARDPARAA